LQQQLEFEGGMMEDRLNLIKDAEVKVLNVNDIMRMLATIVHEQAPMIGKCKRGFLCLQVF